MLFTHIHFSSNIWWSCMTVTTCNSWCCFSVCALSVLPLHSNKTLSCALRHIMISVIFCYSSTIPQQCWRCVEVKHVKSWIYITTKTPLAKSCFKLLSTLNCCQPQANCLTRTFEGLIKTICFCVPLNPPDFLLLSKPDVRMPSLFSHLTAFCMMMSECSYSWSAVSVFCSHQCWLYLSTNTYPVICYPKTYYSCAFALFD